MDREAWQATVHGVAKSWTDLAVKPPALYCCFSECCYMIKTLHKMSLEGGYLNIIKPLYEKPIANTILNQES